MSWLETCPMNERVKFIMAYQKEPDSFKTLCERFNVSRKTGYKWLSRFEEQGFGGLQDRSRAPNRVANKLDKDCRQQILSVKCKHMDWGPRKIIAWLEQEYPSQEWPVPSTAGLLLKQHGLVKARKLRRYVEPYRQPFADCDGPNAVWSIDYKGQFKLQNGQLCYPLTLTDNFSRFLLACDASEKISSERIKQIMERAFREYGLPEIIKSDNGSPFASTGLGAFTELNAWWWKLGIIHERSRPGHPEDNGRHERMHKTLKASAINPAKENMLEQQLAFKSFQETFNYDRPHEAIDNQRPGWLYQPSAKKFPYYLEDVIYPGSFETRRVRLNGTIKWGGREVYVSQALANEVIGLYPSNDQEFEVYFSTKKFALFDEEKRKMFPLKE